MTDKRFQRTEALIGSTALKKITQSKIMVIGLGAVGGHALEALVRAGVGNLTLVDFDVFDITNINRQILAVTDTIGKKKTEVAKKRVLDINPNCKVTVIDEFVTADNIDEILKNKPDFVVDAIDSLTSKCVLMEALYKKEIPFISSMGAALKTDSSKIKFSTLSKTQNDGLAKLIRNRLRKQGLDLNKIFCVSSEEQVDLPETAIFQNEDEQPVKGRKKNTLGSLPTITAIFGLTIANEIIKRIIK
jgi:tRNA A37 threonylcarbamoyladenosine dehydratase